MPDDTPMACVTSEIGGELPLEGDDLLAHDAALAVADAGDGGEDRLAERPVLGLEIEERDGFVHGRMRHGAGLERAA